ncbi:MAG: DNA-directed RNA polymerase subunit delta [Solobacterium sp.]|jgi:DNA-directed RNA polymerase subunit delta|nr:DNA-directed RNA polymerase subunit delta [Solobacterium sp.]MCH4049162.1 DNA-directed RNA polymerase subunit delta [Solobacterium sp.]MCH4074084.1 DNA-directed RNA polymerase subunit delta [Solobacterium sp.]MCI1313312.1 DNA-directed RNA polymerase subunit delta [Solobacterium sp.]MCI1346155.1 DNA-directed RNA polymerase subunit delta [Solobacterium sp.]
MTAKETMTDVAYDYLAKRKKEVEFVKLWQNVCKTLDIPEDRQRRKKSQFYSDLMLDSRFASLEGNKWDLRHRRKYDEVHVNTDDLSLDDDSDESKDDIDNSLDITDDDNEDNRY